MDMYLSPKFGINPLHGFRENVYERTTDARAMTVALLCSSTKQRLRGLYRTCTYKQKRDSVYSTLDRLRLPEKMKESFSGPGFSQSSE